MFSAAIVSICPAAAVAARWGGNDATTIRLRGNELARGASPSREVLRASCEARDLSKSKKCLATAFARGSVACHPGATTGFGAHLAI